MNHSRTPDAASLRRNRLLLVALFLLFFGGMLLAGLLRFSGWRPEGMKNKGEMLQPYGDLRTHAPQLADGGAYRWKDSPRTWLLCSARISPFTAGCRRSGGNERSSGKRKDSGIRFHAYSAAALCCSTTC